MTATNNHNKHIEAIIMKDATNNTNTQIHNIQPVLLDTHILLWVLFEPTKIYSETKDLIEEALSQNRLYISSITLWEIAMLAQKGRINIYSTIEDLLEKISNIDGLNIQDINYKIASLSASLDKFHGDPADRIIISTAKNLASTLVTMDTKIVDWSKNAYVRINNNSKI
jgi:PIN domain nuclease of toxin-antitoxin system